ncbi:hypothetical protein ACK8P5_26585 (plasmid) [Paenibacillus sp. EC2-1]|uniref:hypothetical protein n=1 Tax=Paenibacillus sp. EC2-1 TaxID=3388665 RepID=UPI003BEECD8A
MSSMFKRAPIGNRYNEKRVKEIKLLIEQGVDPLTVTLCDTGGCIQIGCADLAEYAEYTGGPFTYTATAFGWNGDDRYVVEIPQLS